MGFLFIPAIMIWGYLGWHLVPLFDRFIQKKWLSWLLALTACAAIVAFAVINRNIVFGYLVYCVILFGVFDFLRLAFYVFAKETKARTGFLKVYCRGLSVFLIALLLSIGGYINVKQVAVTHYTVDVEDWNDPPLRAAMISDLHLGSVVDNAHFDVIIDKIAKEQPDILFLVGDIFVEDSTREMIVEGLNSLGRLSLPYGIVYVTGNHEFYGREFYLDELGAEMDAANVRFLRDEAILVDGRFYVVGREDASRRGRATLQEIVKTTEPGYPILMIDHQPKDYKQLSDAGIDLVFSGHTHAGQIFPVGQIAELLGMNEMNYGIRRYGNARAIVSSGVGVWGFPMRVGSPSEVVIAEIS